MLSTAVLGYQVVIFLIAVISRGSIGVCGLLVLWTLTHVFFPPLMILQFGTILIGFVVGRSIR